MIVDAGKPSLHIAPITEVITTVCSIHQTFSLHLDYRSLCTKLVIPYLSGENRGIQPYLD